MVSFAQENQVQSVKLQSAVHTEEQLTMELEDADEETQRYMEELQTFQDPSENHAACPPPELSGDHWRRKYG